MYNNIEIYESKNGKSEILSYFDELSLNTSKDNRIKVKKINMYIELLSKYGLTLTEPYIKKLDNEIWELRPSKDRILFSNLYNNKFVLLTVFTKQTQKTPKSEIKKAKKLLKDFKERSDLNDKI